MYSEHPGEVRRRTRNLERKAHDAFIAESHWNRRFSAVTVHMGARLIEVSSPPLWSEHERPENKRGKITKFTAASRHRQMCALARVVKDAPLPIFFTGTYPRQWPGDWKEWKKHLVTFFKAVERFFPEAASMWKLEPQEREAPHFHALIWGVEKIPWQWISVYWAATIHGIDPRMLQGFPVVGGKAGAHLFRTWVDELDVDWVVKDSLNAGTSIESIKSWNGVAFYAAKYLGKQCQTWDGGAGRFWGVRNRKHMPFAKQEEVIVSVEVAVKIKRLVRRFMHSKGRTCSKGWRLKLITDDLIGWLTAAQWCEEEVQRQRPDTPF